NIQTRLVIPSPVAIPGHGGGLGWAPYALLALVLASCTSVQHQIPSSQPHLIAVDAAECRALVRDDASPDSLRQAATRSVERLQKLPRREFQLFDRRVSAPDLQTVLNAVDTASTDSGWPQQICERLRLYRVELAAPFLITGYYQPELAASRTRTER